jgi:ABC-type transport system substrate-binding protein
MLLASMIAVIPTPVRAQTYGPREDNLHIINYGNPDGEFAALEAGEIDITDWPLDAFWTNKWVGEGRVPSEITLDPYAEIGSFEYDINCQKWPTGCDGVSTREGYVTTPLANGTWSHVHTRQRPLTSNDTDAPSYTSPPAPGTVPMGNGSDYDPETSSWKTYYDEDCLWCTMSWGLRLAIAFTTDKDYIVATILEGLGSKMIAWMASPAQEGYLDKANLTDTSFTYNGPHGSVSINTLIFDNPTTGYNRAQMDAKAIELLEAAGFKDHDGDGTRNDPRKVAGVDKEYGTVDDVTTAASNMDDLIFYIRLDDPDRQAAGQKLSADLQAFDVPVDEKVMEKTVCFKNVMVDYNYHLYTGGYSYGADPMDIQYGLFHSSQYWYPVGWSGGYQAFCHVLHDHYVQNLKTSPVRYGNNGWEPGAHNSSLLQNKYVSSIPLWSSASSNAYRTGWTGVVNHAGYGITWGTGGVYFWSLFNMEKGGTDTINLGFKAAPEDLNVITSEWVWDYIVLDSIYEPLLVRNPYNLAEETEILAESWTEGIYEGNLKWFEFTLKDGVKFHDGTFMNASDIKWGIEFMRDCGPGVAWGYSTLKEVRNVTVTEHGDGDGGGKVKFFMEHGSAFALHDCCFVEIINPKVWQAADAAMPEWNYHPENNSFTGTEGAAGVRQYHPHEDDYYYGNGTVDLVADGTGPWKFVSVTGIWEYIDLVAFRDHHMSQEDVAEYLNGAFHSIGNVNYPGSTNEADYIAQAIGIDTIIDVVPDMQLHERSFGSLDSDTWGIAWDEYNEDADVFYDLKVDGIDYSLINLNLLATAG